MDKSLLDLYADYLISSFGPATATGLSGLLQAHLSHDKITRFLSERPYTSANLWQVVKPLVRQVQSEDAVLVIDDSIAHKPHTDPSALIGWHYDHTSGTTVKGINFLTTLYCTGEVSLPVAFALVEKDEEFTDPKTGQAKRRATVSKNTHYQAMLRACVKNGMPFRYVLNDVWFASADNMKLIRSELKKDFVMPLKSSRKVALSEQDKKDGCYQAVETLTLEHGRARAVYLEQVTFPLSLVKQVFTNRDGSQGVLSLVSSDTALDGGQIMGLYQPNLMPRTVAGRSVPQVAQAERFFRVFAHDQDAEQPLLSGSVSFWLCAPSPNWRHSRSGPSAAFRLEKQALCRGGAVSIRSTGKTPARQPIGVRPA